MQRNVMQLKTVQRDDSQIILLYIINNYFLRRIKKCILFLVFVSRGKLFMTTLAFRISKLSCVKYIRI